MKDRLPLSIKSKVFFATALGLITMLVIYLAMGRAFSNITSNIDQLAKPNERLIELNRLFRGVSQLNHLQQKEAVSGRRNPSVSFMKESDTVYKSLDTLKYLFQGDSVQLKRVDSIDQLLMKRRDVFVDYLQLQYQRNASPDIRSFLSKVAEESRKADSLAQSQLLETHKITTTTTISSDTIREERPSFLQRLFGKSDSTSNAQVVVTSNRVDHEVVVAVDTLSFVHTDSLLNILESSLDSIHHIQQKEAGSKQQQEYQLLSVNNSIIHQIVNIINDVEQEEISRLNNETQSAFKTAGDTINILNLIAVIFISVSLLLALFLLLDISKSNKYREELEVINEVVRNEAENKQRFLSNMSHEIRTPLQSIFGYAEQAKLAKKDVVDVDAIYHSASHLLNVVNEVLDYAKVTSGKISFEKCAFDLAEEINHVVKSLQPLALKKDLDLLVYAKKGILGRVEGDAFRLRQILFNIIGNAIKFTDKGWVKVEATLVNNSSDRGVYITVSDTGRGIDNDCLPNLFNPFAQGGNEVAEKYGGTGLGLSIVKNMVEYQGGNIKVESQLEKGTCFTIFLPYKSEANNIVAKTDIEESISLDSGVIWMADDDALILNLGASIFKKHGVVYRVFHNGFELLKAFDKEKPDLIFLDMRMPGMSGIEVCERIRHRTGGRIKIYALTAQVLLNEQKEILEKGFDGIVMKPFRESDLLLAMEGSIKEAQIEVDIDLSALIKMSGDKIEDVAEILEVVREEMIKDLSSLREALIKFDHQQLLLLVHRIAGRVGQAGAIEYSKQLREVENVLKISNNDINEAEISSMIQKGYGFVSSLDHLLQSTYKI